MEDNGHVRPDTHKDPADLDRLHEVLGHYARMLWDIQETRVGLGNRTGAMARDGVPERFSGEAAVVTDALSKTEQQLDRYLGRLAKQHPMADWIAQAPGIGLPGFARLIGVTGRLDRFTTVSKLWKYLGLHTVDGISPKKKRGVPWTHTNCTGGHLRTCTPACTTDHHPNCTPDGIGTAYSPQGRVVCYQIGEAIVKVGRGKYRDAYDIKKAYYESNRPDWPQLRRHRAARLYATKELIKDMWVEWHQRTTIALESGSLLSAAQ